MLRADPAPLKGIMASHATQSTPPATAIDVVAPSRRAVQVAIWPIVLVIYATLLPREIRFEIGALSFFIDRIALIVVLPYIISKIMAGAIRFLLPDTLVLVAGLWMIIAMVAHYGTAAGLQRGGSLALDSTVSYYLARISFRSLQDFRRVLILISPGLFFAGLTVMIESVTHLRIIQPVAERLFGKLPYYIGGEVAGFQDRDTGVRLGLARAKGPFTHAIHAGLYLAVCVPLYLTASIRGWPRHLGHLAGIFSFFSVSSAALLGLALSYALVAYDRLQRHVRELSWTLLTATAAIFFLIVQILSNSGVPALIGRYLTFDPATAFYRQMIWRYGLESVRMNPLTGIGLAGYERPVWMISESIDAHWLLLAVRFGVIPSIALLLATILAIVSLSRASVNAPLIDQRFYRGIAISLFIMALAMFSVSLWGGIQSWYNILLGGCVVCAQHRHKPQDPS